MFVARVFYLHRVSLLTTIKCIVLMTSNKSARDREECYHTIGGRDRREARLRPLVITRINMRVTSIITRAFFRVVSSERRSNTNRLLLSFPVREPLGIVPALLRLSHGGLLRRGARHFDARPHARTLHGLLRADGVRQTVRGCLYGSENRHVLLENFNG